MALKGWTYSDLSSSFEQLDLLPPYDVMVCGGPFPW